MANFTSFCACHVTLYTVFVPRFAQGSLILSLVKYTLDCSVFVSVGYTRLILYNPFPTMQREDTNTVLDEDSEDSFSTQEESATADPATGSNTNETLQESSTSNKDRAPAMPHIAPTPLPSTPIEVRFTHYKPTLSNYLSSQVLMNLVNMSTQKAHQVFNDLDRRLKSVDKKQNISGASGEKSDVIQKPRTRVKQSSKTHQQASSTTSLSVK